MKQLALLPLFVLFTATAEAQPFPGLDPAGPADRFDLVLETDDLAVLEYYNSDPPNSAGYPQTLSDGGLTVELHLTITGTAEILRVTPPEGWVAIPEVIHVIDGDTGVIELRRGQYFGF